MAVVAAAGAGVVAYTFLRYLDVLGVDGNEEEIACDEFEFSRSDWLSKPEGGWTASRTITERERIADAFFRCGTLHGMKRAEVETMIGHGRPKRNQRGVVYDIGWINDGIGPGDGWEMTVLYDERGRVANLPGGSQPPGGGT